ncbi:MAG: hypothetical protein KGQ60_00385 [Planctomycetes bacterium]|nr:hypothetical protein [Planctomycetota bacterium]
MAGAIQLRTKLNANGKRTQPDRIQPVSPPQVNLEEQLQNMFQDTTQSPILLCLGQKGGGKSFRTMTLLMWLLRNNIFDQYFLVLPTFYYEASNSYAWLKPFEDRVFIAREYTPEMSQAFLNRKDETVPPHTIPRTFLWLDDVGMNESFRMDRSFVGLLSVARHKRLSVCLCYHSLTSGHTLSPFLRQNVTHTLLFRVTNEKLLESIFEELISMTGHFDRFREFKQVYNQHTCSQVNPSTGEVTRNFNGICINNSLGCLDWNVGQWFPEETQTLQTFLENMKQAMQEQKLPPPDKNQNLDEVTPQVVENLKPVGGGGSKSKSTSTTTRSELTPDSWPKLVAAAKEPIQFLTHPRNLVKYQNVKRETSHIPTLHTAHGNQRVIQHPRHNR